MADETDTQEVADKAKEVRNDDPALLAQIMERRTVSGAGAFGGGEIVPRRRVTFDVDGAECCPGVFVDGEGRPVTFKLTLVSLTSAEEIKVTQGVMDPAQAVFATAKASIEALNGTRVQGDKLDFLWEALGPGGRQIVVTLYQQVGACSPAGMGKALASCLIR